METGLTFFEQPFYHPYECSVDNRVPRGYLASALARNVAAYGGTSIANFGMPVDSLKPVAFLIKGQVEVRFRMVYQSRIVAIAGFRCKPLEALGGFDVNKLEEQFDHSMVSFPELHGIRPSPWQCVYLFRMLHEFMRTSHFFIRLAVALREAASCPKRIAIRMPLWNFALSKFELDQGSSSTIFVHDGGKWIEYHHDLRDGQDNAALEF